MSRILGLDYGERRIGIALSDPLQIIAKPFTVIDRKKTDYISQLSKMIVENDIISIVVGLPLTLHGKKSKQTEVVLSFINELQSKLPVPVSQVDVRLSSIAAEKSLHLQNVKTGYEKGRIDETAAAIFLQEYLDSKV